MPKSVGVVAVLLLGVFCGFQVYHQTGMVHATRKNGYGCICHNFDPAPGVQVWIAGPDSLRAGEIGTFAVNVARTGNIGAGFNVASFYGDLLISDSAGTQLLTESSTDSLELTHTNTRLASGSDTISWTFRYRAPITAGVVDTIYSAGNAVNNDTLPDGDFWNFGQNFLVHVVNTTSIPENAAPLSFRLMQNYPNPFNPSTHITYQLPKEERVTLSVYDLLGRPVAMLVDGVQGAGLHTFSFDGRQLSSGVYVYRLSSGGVSQARKMILAR